MSDRKIAAQGYPRLASILGPRGLGIYRRFADLNALNILHLQAELLYLEQELKILIDLDNESGDPNRKLFAKSAHALRTSGEGQHGYQWQKILEIRALLKEYNEALLQQAELKRLASAKPYDVGLIHSWIIRPEGGNQFLQDIEGDPWDGTMSEDLVLLDQEPELDAFTSWLRDRCVPWMHKKIFYRWKKPMKGFEDVGLVNWADEYFVAVSKLVSVMVASIFLSMTILVLYFIKKLIIRLIVVLIFSVLFASCLAFFTKARPIEIFAATAACASVQVVFVGSTTVL